MLQRLFEIEKIIFTKKFNFEAIALKVFRLQAIHSPVYQKYLQYLSINPKDITSIRQIPFLPIELFKNLNVLLENLTPELEFRSSGTTGQNRSKHYVHKAYLYQQSFTKGFMRFYGNIKDYQVVALLPSYQENTHSSLIYMIEQFIQQSSYSTSGFYSVSDIHSLLKNNTTPTLLIGVSFALLDLAEQQPFPLKNCIVMETGGMKGRRKEIIRKELHQILTHAFQVTDIHSEYGMTELLSQAYSMKDGVFSYPPWMRVFTREINDPFTHSDTEQNGLLNVIDLANLYSCSFIATSDLGKVYSNGNFEVLGRIDNSDIRGCNLLIS